MTLRQRRVTARQLCDQLRATTGNLVSDQTARNRRRANNLRPWRLAVHPTLLQRHRTARQDRCSRHVRWHRVQWSFVLFSDETWFSPCSSTTAENVCIDVQERDLLTSPSVSVCRLVSAASWFLGASSFHDRTPLNVTDGILTGDRHLQEIIRPLVLPTLQHIGVGAMFQDDKLRPHCARGYGFPQAKQCRQDGSASIFPRSEPIEHRWGELGRRIRSNHAPLNKCAQLTKCSWQSGRQGHRISSKVWWTTWDGDVQRALTPEVVYTHY